MSQTGGPVFSIPFHTSPSPQYSTHIRLTASLKHELQNAASSGQSVSLRFRDGSAVLTLGSREYLLQSSKEKNCDVLQLPEDLESNEGCLAIGSVQHKLNVQRTLDDSLKSKLRAKEAEVQMQRTQSQAVMISNKGHRASGKVTTTVTRQITPPLSAVSKPPVHRGLAHSQLGAGSNHTKDPSPAPSSAPLLPPAARKTLDPPRPNSQKPWGHLGPSGQVKRALAGSPATAMPPRAPTPPLSMHSTPTRALTPPPDATTHSHLHPHALPHPNAHSHDTEQIQPSQPAPVVRPPVALTPPVITRIAVSAAACGDLQLCVAAVLHVALNMSLSTKALYFAIQEAYRLARRKPEQKEYLKRVVGAVCDLVPPNKMRLKPEILEKELAHLEVSAAPPAKGAAAVGPAAAGLKSSAPSHAASPASVDLSPCAPAGAAPGGPASGAGKTSSARLPGATSASAPAEGGVKGAVGMKKKVMAGKRGPEGQGAAKVKPGIGSSSAKGGAGDGKAVRTTAPTKKRHWAPAIGMDSETESDSEPLVISRDGAAGRHAPVSKAGGGEGKPPPKKKPRPAGMAPAVAAPAPAPVQAPVLPPPPPLAKIPPPPQLSRLPTSLPIVPAPAPAPARVPAPAPTRAPTLAPAPTRAPALAPASAPTRTAAPAPARAPAPAPTRAPALAPAPAPTRAPALAPAKHSVSHAHDDLSSDEEGAANGLHGGTGGAGGSTSEDSYGQVSPGDNHRHHRGSGGPPPPPSLRALPPDRSKTLQASPPLATTHTNTSRGGSAGGGAHATTHTNTSSRARTTSQDHSSQGGDPHPLHPEPVAKSTSRGGSAGGGSHPHPTLVSPSDAAVPMEVDKSTSRGGSAGGVVHPRPTSVSPSDVATPMEVAKSTSRDGSAGGGAHAHPTSASPSDAAAPMEDEETMLKRMVEAGYLDSEDVAYARLPSPGPVDGDDADLEQYENPSPQPREPITTTPQHAALRTEYNRKYEVYFKVHQKYNAVMGELEALQAAATADGVSEERRRVWQQQLWSLGACKYASIKRWLRVIAHLHQDLGDIRTEASRFVSTFRPDSATHNTLVL